MQRRERQYRSAICANEATRIERFFRVIREKSGACSSSDVITSGGRKFETTMEMGGKWRREVDSVGESVLELLTIFL